jgi:hypothetical protein
MSREASAITVFNSNSFPRPVPSSHRTPPSARSVTVPFLIPPLRPAPQILRENLVQLLGSSIRVSAVIRSVPSFKLPLLQMSSNIPSEFLAPGELDKP